MEDCLRTLSIKLTDNAKRWWGVGFVIASLPFLLSISVMFYESIVKISPYISIVFIITYVVVQHIAKHQLGKAQWICRKLDIRESFGAGIDSAELRNFLSSIPSKIASEYKKENGDIVYFASQESLGAKRSMENLEESSWFTNKQALWLAIILLIASLLILASAIGILIIGIHIFNQQQTTITLSKLVTAIMSLVFSIGVISLFYDYFSFANQSDNICKNALQAKRNDSLKEEQAFDLWSQYHIIRVSHPPLPSWFYRLVRKKLNGHWETYKSVESQT
jgi:membrane protein YdbS with pleckstrin-like domain